MNYLRLKCINLLIITMLFFPFLGESQSAETTIMQSIVAAGNNATGSSGKVAYSIGQVFYTYNGVGTVYNVAQGVQQNGKDDTLDVPDIDKPTTEIFIFPNPTTDFVNISMSGLELQSGLKSYKLYDLQAKLLKQSKIDQDQTQVSLGNLSTSIYILVVYVDNKILKTFKIVKN